MNVNTGNLLVKYSTPLVIMVEFVALTKILDKTKIKILNVNDKLFLYVPQIYVI